MRKKQVKCFIRFCSKELVDRLHRLGGRSGEGFCVGSDAGNSRRGGDGSGPSE